MSESIAGSLILDAEALYRELLRDVQRLMGPATRLAGITSGGAWLVERLHKDLNLPGKASVLSSALHRDDFAQRADAARFRRQRRRHPGARRRALHGPHRARRAQRTL